MSSTVTDLAHCGACAAPMRLQMADGRAWYVCGVCGHATEPRATVQAADADVVWVPVPAPRPRRRPAAETEVQP